MSRQISLEEVTAALQSYGWSDVSSVAKCLLHYRNKKYYPKPTEAQIEETKVLLDRLVEEGRAYITPNNDYRWKRDCRSCVYNLPGTLTCYLGEDVYIGNEDKHDCNMSQVWASFGVFRPEGPDYPTKDAIKEYRKRLTWWDEYLNGLGVTE